MSIAEMRQQAQQLFKDAGEFRRAGGLARSRSAHQQLIQAATENERRAADLLDQARSEEEAQR